MTEILYEYSGPRFDAEQSERFIASVGRDYYSADCRVIPDREAFHLRNSRIWAGRIPISEHRCIGARADVRRSSRQVRNGSGSDIFLVWIPLKGNVTITQNGRSTIVGQGSVALSSSQEPLCIVTSPDADQEHLSYQITVPANLVADILPDPGEFCALSCSSEIGGTRVARELFLSLYEEADGMDAECGETLARSALSALLRSMASERGDPAPTAVSGREMKLQRLLDYLEMNQSDPSLSTERAAEACQISTRYLHSLLKSRGIRFHNHLWRSRLECAFRQLTNPALSGRTIAEIAYSVGFKSSAHFSRAFQRSFNCSPREVRQSQCSGAPTGTEHSTWK